MVKSTDYNGEVKMAKKQRKEMVHVPKIKEWIKKTCVYVHTTEYSSTMKRNKFVIYMAKWMTLRNMLTEEILSQRTYTRHSRLQNRKI